MTKTRNQRLEQPSPAVQLPPATRKKKNPSQKASGSMATTAEQEKNTATEKMKGKEGEAEKKKGKEKKGEKRDREKERKEKKGEMEDHEKKRKERNEEKEAEEAAPNLTTETEAEEAETTPSSQAPSEKELPSPAKKRQKTQTPENDDDGENEKEKSGSEEGSEKEEEVDFSGEEIEALRPDMHFSPDKYNQSIKVPTRCYVREVLDNFKQLGLTDEENDWFMNHPQFCHIFHMPFEGHMLQPMWMLQMRTAKIERKKEVWFVVNGVPIRYGIREHFLISGLDCNHYPGDYMKKGSYAFRKRHFDNGKVIRKDVREKLMGMKADGKKERLKMAVLYFLCSVIYSPSRTGVDANPIEDLFLRYVDDLELCQTFPWGRYSYDRMVETVRATVNHYDGVDVFAPYAFPGFCIPLELLALEAIPHLGKGLREPVEAEFDDCPRMCRASWKKLSLKGWKLEQVYENLRAKNDDIDSLLIAADEEKEMLAELGDFEDVGDENDPTVHSWEKRLKQGFTVAFEDLRVADVEGRKGVVSKVQKEKKGKKEKQDKVEERVEEVAEALKTMVDQIGITNTIMERMERRLDVRIARLEGEVEALKADVAA